MAPAVTGVAVDRLGAVPAIAAIATSAAMELISAARCVAVAGLRSARPGASAVGLRKQRREKRARPYPRRLRGWFLAVRSLPCL